MNRVILKGRLGADPELRTTGGGTSVASVSLATSKTYLKDGEKKEQTEWHRLSIWGARGEAFANYHSKGDEALVEGEIRYGQYEDSEGVTRYTTDIVVTNWEFVGSRGGDAEKESAPKQQSKGSGKSSNKGKGKAKNKAALAPQEGEDDLPF